MLVVVVSVSGHSPSVSASPIWNVLASFFLIELFEAGGKRTWYRSPPLISKSMHAEVPGSGGTSAIGTLFACATALIWKVPLRDFVISLTLTALFVPVLSLYLKPLPEALQYGLPVAGSVPAPRLKT